MKVEVFPSQLAGTAAVPGSKSVAQRLMAAALLARGTSIIHAYPQSDDCTAVKKVVQTLGAVVEEKNGALHVRGGFPHCEAAGIRYPKSIIQCGESGLASRMFTPIAALYDEAIAIYGEGSLLDRPFDDFQLPMQQLGVHFQSNKGKLPLSVCGPIQGGVCEVDGSVSSQFLTGFLMALPAAQKDSVIKVRDLKSIPYIDTTLAVLRQFGVHIHQDRYEEFHVPGGQRFQAIETTVPGDWSAAAFVLCAAAIASEEGVRITNITEQFRDQADSIVVDILREAGAIVHDDARGLFVRHQALHAFECDLNHAPDLFPALVALAAHADGVSTLRGVKRLVHKESNRAKVLHEEFAKANVRIAVRDDEMKVYPGALRSATMHSHNDHRIAMAATLLALQGDKITIQNAECVSKSFVEYFDTMRSLGLRVQAR